MTNETYIELIDDYKKKIIELIKEEGHLQANVGLFVEKLNEDESTPETLLIQIPDEFMSSDDSKDFFVDTILPGIYKKFSEKYTIYGIGYSSEAWVRRATEAQLDSVKDYKELPISQEVLLMCIDSDVKAETVIYDIKKSSLRVKDGTPGFVRGVELVECETYGNPEHLGGRFANLYKKLKNVSVSE